MEFSEYKKTVIDATEESEGLTFKLAFMWLHPERIPVILSSISKGGLPVIKVPKCIYGQDSYGAVFSHTVIGIGGTAFKNNIGITDVILPESISEIPNCAFAGCSSLEHIVIPKKISSVGFRAFESCDKLTDVYYGGSEEDWLKTDIKHEVVKYEVSNKPGLICDIDKIVTHISGNERLMNANIHYNCEIGDDTTPDFTVTCKGRDITSFFEINRDND